MKALAGKPPALWIAQAVLALACVVLFGWLIESRLLTQISPRFAPMQFNTALGFGLASAALIMGLRHRPQWATGLALVLVVLSGTTFAQYLTNSNFGIDTFFNVPFITTRTSHIGRMAPNTAVAFVLFGLCAAAMFWLVPRRPEARTWIFHLNSVVGFLGLAGLLIYLIAPEDAAGWGHFTRMAFHTACGFILLSVALALISRESHDANASESWLPVMSGLSSALVALGLWAMLEIGESDRLSYLVSQRHAAMSRALEQNLRGDMAALETATTGMVRAQETANRLLNARPQWRAFAAFNNEQHTLVNVGFDAAFDPFEHAALQQYDGAFNVAWVADDALFMAIRRWQSLQQDYLTLVAKIDLPTRCETIASYFLDDLNYRLADANGLVCTSVQNRRISQIYEEQFISAVPITDDLAFTLTVSNTQDFAARVSSRLPAIFLSTGLLFSSLLSVTLVYLLRYRRQQVELREQILERTRAQNELMKRTQELEETNRDLDEFAYVVSHDLREPLRGISTSARFLVEDHGPEIPQGALVRLETIQQLTGRLTRLIEDLLHYSRVGSKQAKIVSLDLDEVVNDVLQDIAHLIDEKQVIVTRDGGKMPTVQGDRTRISEVFSNLIGNAIKYNDAEIKRIGIGIRKEHDENIYFVRDNGIGIEPQDRQKIFRIFTRLHHKDAYGGGSGAGLTIVKRIVETHGGRIWIDDNPSGRSGTTISFTLGEPRTT